MNKNTQAKITVLITNKKNEVLLIKEYINNKYNWNIIKGTYDKLNENIFETAKRECFEEISVNVELINSLGVFFSKTDEKIRIQFNFLAKIIEGEPKLPTKEIQTNNNESIIEYKWFTQEELKKMKSNEFVSNRTYSVINNWLKNKIYPLGIIQDIEM
ncbi:NUDIX hydrolase [Patescibacteria group bacterium]|nr:NUDIX hydrolase [Patescibacteria group bacterium]